MSFLTLLPQTATITTVGNGSLDSDRNFVRTTATGTGVPCRLEMIDTSEPASGGVGVEDRWRIFLPAETVLTAADEITVSPRRYRVLGTPERVFGMSAEHHVEAVLLYVGDVSQT